MIVPEFAEEIRETTIVDEEDITIFEEDDDVTVAVWTAASDSHPLDHGYSLLDPPRSMMCEDRGIELLSAEVVNIEEFVRAAAEWPGW